MTLQGYISFLTSIFATLIFLPGLEDLIKVLVIVVVVVVTIVINLLFQWQRMKEMIVNQVVAEVMMKVNNRFFLKELSKILRDANNYREERDAKK